MLARRFCATDNEFLKMVWAVYQTLLIFLKGVATRDSPFNKLQFPLQYYTACVIHCSTYVQIAVFLFAYSVDLQ